MTDPARTATGQFLPGRSGNPAGRPLGARNKSTLLLELLDKGESETIVRAVIDRALAGDRVALRACFTRLLPAAKDAPIAIGLPELASVEDVAEAGSALIAAVAMGEITPCEAQRVMTLLTRQLKILAAAHRDRESARACISPVLGGASAGPALRPRPAQTGERPHRPGSVRRAPSSAATQGARAADACISPVLAGTPGRRAPMRAVPRHDPPVPAAACIFPVLPNALPREAPVRAATAGILQESNSRISPQRRSQLLCSAACARAAVSASRIAHSAVVADCPV